MPLNYTELREIKKSGDIDGLLSILQTGDVREIRDAITILGELRSRKAVRPLIGLLETNDIQIRANAAWALGEIGDAKAVLPLMGLLNDQSENVRINAAWSLGRIGDRRAIPGLKYALNNCSSEFRKHAKDALVRMEFKRDIRRQKDDDSYDYEENEISSSRSMDIPLVNVDVPSSQFECDYIYRVEGGSKKIDDNTIKFSKDIVIKDTDNENRLARGNARRIVLGLNKNCSGLVSIDILFKYKDNNDARAKVSTVWLQMAGGEKHGLPFSDNIFNIDVSNADREPDLEEPVEVGRGRIFHPNIKNEKVRFSRSDVPKHTGYDIPQYREPKEPEHEIIPDEPPILDEHPFKGETNEADLKKKSNGSVKTESQIEEIKTPNLNIAPQTQAAPLPGKTEVNVNSAFQLLNDIGMSGMINAASTLTQLSGQEPESVKSQLRTIPADQIRNEIVGLGDSIVFIEVKLHGRGAGSEVNGKMQLYVSRDIALDIANELLCNPPDAACHEFTPDIISTLKETANIFGGHYVSAVSEYIEVPIMLETPAFKTGPSAQIAESAVKDAGKIEFALATDLSLGKNKTGRLIMLLDPKSMEMIVKKLF